MKVRLFLSLVVLALFLSSWTTAKQSMNSEELTKSSFDHFTNTQTTISPWLPLPKVGKILDKFAPSDDPVRKIEGLGLAGFITSIVGLLVFAIVLGPLSLIFGLISYTKISRNPMKYKGQGFAITAIVLGILETVFAILYIMSM